MRIYFVHYSPQVTFDVIVVNMDVDLEVCSYPYDVLECPIIAQDVAVFAGVGTAPARIANLRGTFMHLLASIDFHSVRIMFIPRLLPFLTHITKAEEGDATVPIRVSDTLLYSLRFIVDIGIYHERWGVGYVL